MKFDLVGATLGSPVGMCQIEIRNNGVSGMPRPTSSEFLVWCKINASRNANSMQYYVFNIQKYCFRAFEFYL